MASFDLKKALLAIHFRSLSINENYEMNTAVITLPECHHPLSQDSDRTCDTVLSYDARQLTDATKIPVTDV